MSTLARITRRLDTAALAQLREVAATQAAEIDALRVRLAFAEEAAESWRDDALRMQLELCELTHSAPGITVGGALVKVPCGSAA